MNENTESTTTITPATEPEKPSEKTFTKAELEAIVGKRISKALKGMPSEEEITAFQEWKAGQQTEKDKWDAMVKERDESKTALSAAMAKVEQYEREKFLLGKGVNADDVDYYAFKIGKLATDTTGFEKAAEQYLKAHPPAGTVQVDFGAPLGGGQPAKSENEMMNNLIRNTRK